MFRADWRTSERRGGPGGGEREMRASELERMTEEREREWESKEKEE